MPVVFNFMRTSFGPVVGRQTIVFEADVQYACLVPVLVRPRLRA
jgi:hypothetical protein